MLPTISALFECCHQFWVLRGQPLGQSLKVWTCMNNLAELALCASNQKEWRSKANSIAFATFPLNFFSLEVFAVSQPIWKEASLQLCHHCRNVTCGVFQPWHSAQLSRSFPASQQNDVVFLHIKHIIIKSISNHKSMDFRNAAPGGFGGASGGLCRVLRLTSPCLSKFTQTSPFQSLNKKQAPRCFYHH